MTLTDVNISPHQSTISICSGNTFWCTVDNDTLISTGIAMLLTLLLGVVVAARLKEGRPGKLQMLFEALLSYVRTLTHDAVSEEADFIVPIAVTLAFFILIANWLDFFPLNGPVVPANSDWNLTLAMALVVFLVVQGYAIRVKGPLGYLQHSPAACIILGALVGLAIGAFNGSAMQGGEIGGAVGLLLGVVGAYTRHHEGRRTVLGLIATPFSVALAAIEDLVKPVTLSLRLFGNILAGVIMVELIPQLFPVWLSWLPLAIWKGFDVFFIGSIQALIFMLLTIIYFGMAREGLDEEGHGHAAAPQTA